MTGFKFYAAGYTSALSYAINYLKNCGYTILSQPEGATHLILPVPSFDPDGRIKGGGELEELLGRLPKNITVLGGNLDRPELSGYHTIDFLLDPQYLAQNASITAHCAIKLAMAKLPVTLDGCPALVIGWGRIGKCLARLLKQLGADVTVAARKETDRAMLSALDYKVSDTADLDTMPYRVIFNTVPTMISVLSPGKALKIDLASVLGLGSSDVIWARGLPNKDAPESSGNLIALTVIRHAAEKEVKL
jgi:dipicolinate synthase subunit A